MTLYTIIIETQSISGDVHSDIAGAFQTEKEAQEVIDRFNKLGLSSVHGMGYPEAKMGLELEVGKAYIDFDALEKLIEPEDVKNEDH